MMQSQALATASDDPPNRRTTVWLRSHYAPFLEITVASTGCSVSCRRWPLRAYAFSALSQNSNTASCTYRACALRQERGHELDPPAVPAHAAGVNRTSLSKLEKGTGTEEQIAAVVKEYRVYVAAHQESGGNYTVDHSSFYYLINPEGKFVRVIAGDVSGEELAERLRHWINKTV